VVWIAIALPFLYRPERTIDRPKHTIGFERLKVTTLTPTSYIVLGLVRQAGEATPYALKQMAAATVGNFFSIPHSQIYAEPERLAKAGYLAVRREQSGRRRKHYALTEKGRRALAGWLDTPTGELYELRDPALLKLALGGDPVALAHAQIPVHEERLEQFQTIRRVLEASGVPAEELLVVDAGVGHEREYLRFWRKVAGG
jgi:PadR family transcriptional regulator, regulatory protein AphA